MNPKGKSTTEESTGLKNYLRYVRQRVKLLRIGAVDCSDNQYSYFTELSNSLKEYQKNHKLYLGYILGKIDLEGVKQFLGYSERDTFRYLSKQRKFIISFIQEKELQLFAKYPFTDRISLWGVSYAERED